MVSPPVFFSSDTILVLPPQAIPLFLVELLLVPKLQLGTLNVPPQVRCYSANEKMLAFPTEKIIFIFLF